MSKEFRTESDDRRENLAGGMVRSPSDGKVDYTLVRKGPLFERWAALLARGAKVYGKNNWLLATESTDVAARDKTKARFAESAARHFEQWLSGDRSEDHAAAVLFNLNGYEHMLDTDGVAHARSIGLDVQPVTAIAIATDGTVTTGVGYSKPAAPKVGDRVRVTSCEHANKAIGTLGTVTRIDMLDDEDLPFYVSLDAPIADYGADVWCGSVEVVS